MTDLSAMLAKLRKLEGNGSSILDLMKAAGLDCKQGFRGGDWRSVKFDRLVLDQANFKETRLHGATFAGTSVNDTDFHGAEGATPVRKPLLGLFAAKNWRDAILDDHQLLALQYRAYQQAPDREPLPISQFIGQGLINASNYLDFMRNSHDYDLARGIYDQLKREGVAPNKYALTELICLSEKQDVRIDGLYNEATVDRVEIDEVLLNAMADCYLNLAKSDDVRALFVTHGLQPDEYYYNIMINKADSRQKAEAYLQQMSGAEIAPSNITINSLMKKCEEWEDRRALIESMKGMGISVRSWELNNLLLAAKNKHQLRESLDLFRELQIPKDIVTHNTRMNKRKDLREAIVVAREAISVGLKPNHFTQTALMRWTTSIVEVCQVMALLKSFDIDIFNDKTINRLIHLSPDQDWSWIRVQGLERSGATPSQQAKALIVHWINEGDRQQVLRDIFGALE